jgi:hypothetical protein
MFGRPCRLEDKIGCNVYGTRTGDAG